MAIALPGPDAVPDGPHRDFLVQLHDLYDRAGQPAARQISRSILKSRDLETVSHETVSSVLRGKAAPNLAKIRSIVVALRGMALPPNPDDEVTELLDLWRIASEYRSHPLVLTLVAPSSFTRVREAIAQGDYRQASSLLTALGDDPTEARLREQLGFLDLPPVDRAILAALWLQLTEESGDVAPIPGAAADVTTEQTVPDSRANRSRSTDLPAVFHEVFGEEMPAVPIGEMRELTVSLPADPARLCRVILMNTTRPVDIATFAPELMSREAELPRQGVGHLILLSLSSVIAAELREVELGWDVRDAYPFRIGLFGSDEIDGWTPGEFTVRLRATLRRRVVLPPEWRNYLGAPAQLCLRGELAAALDDIYVHQLPMRAINETGSVLDGSLLDHVRMWLDRPEEPTLLLVGDFGDGKSFFTYSLARRLCSEAVHGLAGARVPLRLSLAELPAAGSGRELLRRRLEDLGIELASWRRLAEAHPTLVVLDGFDEMSGDLSRPAIAHNTELLRDCCEEFADSKILITSRTNVFGTTDDQRQILERIGRPRTLRLAAVERREVLRSLRGRATHPRLHHVIDRLQTLHDPIGLATKPLYYEMIQRTLPALPDMSFDEHVLYEKYVLDTLYRKLKLLEDVQRRTPPGDIVANLMTILEQVAVDLQRSEVPYVFLKDLDDRARRSGGSDAGLAHLLWRLRDDSQVAPGHQHDDATARIGIRSLLKRAPGGDEARWPVAFFHRSVQEYFVARGIARAVRSGPERARPLLAEAALSPEIRHFVVLILRAEQAVSGAGTLRQLVRGARLAEPPTAVGGNALSLLAELDGNLSGQDWSGLMLDGADLRGADLQGVSFRRSSLLRANLDNTDLTNADLRDADLSGVRLEETAGVTAVAAVDDGPVFAAYNDGRIRMWAPGPHDSANAVVGTLAFEPDRLWLTPGGALVAVGAAEVAVLHRHPEWRVIARFPTQSRYLSPVWRNGRSVVVVEDQTGGRSALWQGPAPGERRVVNRWNAVSWAVDGDEVMAVASGEGVTVEINHEGRRLTAEISDHVPPRCVDVRRADRGIELIVGNDLGEVIFRRYERAAWGWRVREVWRAALHEGPVASVSFLGGDRLVSGSGDRSVCVVPLHQPTGGDPVNIVRLQVRFRCRGAKIDGLRGEREYDMLSRLRDA